MLLPWLAAAGAKAPGPAPETWMPCAVSVAFHLPSWLQDAAGCGFPVERGQQHVPQGCPFLPPQLDANMALGECQQIAICQVVGRVQYPGSGCFRIDQEEMKLWRTRQPGCAGSALIQPPRGSVGGCSALPECGPGQETCPSSASELWPPLLRTNAAVDESARPAQVQAPKGRAGPPCLPPRP